MKINLTEWKEFEFGSIFKFDRGKRLVKSDQISGDIAYISSSKRNNGIDNFISPPGNMTIYKNAITLNNSGSVGYCFFHKYEFVASDHCTVITLKDKNVQLNSLISMFLIPVLESMKSKYNFAREINDKRLKKEKIKLPVDKFNKPDWTFIQSYIKILSKDIAYTNVSVNLESKPSVIKSTNEFKLNDLFKVRGSRKSFTKHEIIQGEYLYITTSNKNNGVVSTSDLYTEEGKVITIDSATDGKAFYQEFNFVGSDHVEVLEPKNFVLNKYIGLYIISILNLQIVRYSFGRKRSQARIKQELIKLPIDDLGFPDWRYMEDFIKTLPFSNNL